MRVSCLIPCNFTWKTEGPSLDIHQSLGDQGRPLERGLEDSALDGDRNCSESQQKLIRKYKLCHDAISWGKA